jgi:hypothetical protein
MKKILLAVIALIAGFSFLLLSNDYYWKQISLYLFSDDTVSLNISSMNGQEEEEEEEISCEDMETSFACESDFRTYGTVYSFLTEENVFKFTSEKDGSVIFNNYIAEFPAGGSITIRFSSPDIFSYQLHSGFVIIKDINGLMNILLDRQDTVSLFLDDNFKYFLVDSGEVGFSGFNSEKEIIVNSNLIEGDELVVYRDEDSNGLLINNYGSEFVNLDVLRNATNADANIKMDKGSSVLLIDNGDTSDSAGGGFLIIPQSKGIGVICNSSYNSLADQCFMGKKEVVSYSEGQYFYEPSAPNLKLLNYLGEQILLSEGLNKNISFSSALIDGILLSEPVNFLALAKRGTGMDNFGADCKSMELKKGIVNILQQSNVDGLNFCSVPPVIIENDVAFNGEGDICTAADVCTIPSEGIEIRVYNIDNEDYRDSYGQGIPSESVYEYVFNNEAGLEGSCETDNNGKCIVGIEKRGNFLVVLKHFDSESRELSYKASLIGLNDFKDIDEDKDGDLAKNEIRIMK